MSEGQVADMLPYLQELREKAAACKHDPLAIQFFCSPTEFELLKALGIEESGAYGLAGTIDALAIAAQHGVMLGRLKPRSPWARLLEMWRRRPL